ncbi:hypothetical protein SOCE26_079730 [Sorangium cellulosum]|uniref:Uncharacterized protein n=2 Tax=Sorangium cellulosum TaxID=56 RepID=A0A2L0F4L5_SORCE|nr:hypothetical protein SOCE26_079730 [Sorangium cellulosum]
MMSSGCELIVLDPFQGGWDDPESSSVVSSSVVGGATSSGSGVAAGSLNVIAARAGDVPPGRTLVPGLLSDPDALVLFFSDSAQQCADPVVSTECDGESVWQFILVLPPGLDTPGIVAPSTPGVYWQNYERYPYPSCGGGGGGGTPFGGTIEIVSSDATSLHVKVSGTNTPPTINGDHTVQLCSPSAAPALGE